MRVMKTFLVVTALLEAVTGVTLIVSPAVPESLLVGVGHDTPGGLVVARIAGAARAGSRLLAGAQ